MTKGIAIYDLWFRTYKPLEEVDYEKLGLYIQYRAHSFREEPAFSSAKVLLHGMHFLNSFVLQEFLGHTRLPQISYISALYIRCSTTGRGCQLHSRKLKTWYYHR